MLPDPAAACGLLARTDEVMTVLDIAARYGPRRDRGTAAQWAASQVCARRHGRVRDDKRSVSAIRAQRVWWRRALKILNIPYIFLIQ